MKKTIYNVQVELKNKNHYIKLLNLVKEHNLETNENKFKKGDYFRKGMGYGFSAWMIDDVSTFCETVTEAEFLELLKEHKQCTNQQ